MAVSRSNFRDLLREALALPATGHGHLAPVLESLLAMRPEQPAAVLVGIVMHDAGPTVLLTRRTDHLTDHPGQVSFPGGRTEPFDRDAVAAALREAEEETGLPSNAVEVVGTLPQYRTISNFRVTPVVGLVPPGLVLTPNHHEVAEVFEVPLALLREPGLRERRSRNFMGNKVEYWAFACDGPLIWGVTAAMLVEICERLDRVEGSPQ